MKILYRIGVQLFRLGIYLASFRSEKAAFAISGRKNQTNPPPKKNVRYWFHCASLGEFEQARPLIEAYKKQDENIEICLTFFSPSGYEQRKNWELATWVGYLPFDSPSAARRFVSAMQADRVFFVKYEFWYFFVKEIRRAGLPFYLISARLRDSQPFFKWYGSLYREMLTCYTHIFTQDNPSVSLLRSVGITHASFAGDTRFDRVSQMSKKRKELPLIEAFCRGHFTLVAGSCWPPEEKLIEAAYVHLHDYHWVLVPHDISESHLVGIEKRFPAQSIRYSALEKGEDRGTRRILIVDRIGLLGNIYPYGQAALIGGGFVNVLHNILEAAVWGIPVMYGSNTKKNPEAKALAEWGGGMPLDDEKDFVHGLQQLDDDILRNRTGAQAAKWISDNTGASERILSFIEEKAF